MSSKKGPASRPTENKGILAIPDETVCYATRPVPTEASHVYEGSTVDSAR